MFSKSMPTVTLAPPTAMPEPPTPEATATAAPESASAPAVLMTTSITADGLTRIYAALGRQAAGRVAVKISSGEPGGHNFLASDLIAPLV